jgi:hypothetical protein
VGTGPREDEQAVIKDDGQDERGGCWLSR